MKKIGALLICLLFFHISSLIAAEIKPYRVYLRPGKVLTRLSDKKEVVIDRGIYALVKETNPNRRDLFLVYDKDNKPVYQTSALGLVEIEGDIQMHSQVNAEIIYPPRTELKSINRSAYFDTQFNLHLDQLQTTPFDSIYSQELATALGNRYEVRTLYISELPVNFGVGLNYQTAYWENDVDEVKLSILSFGPQLQRYLYEQEKMAISLHLGVEFAPIYRTSSGSSVEKFQATLFDIGLESLWVTEYGKWSLGAHYRRHDLTLQSSTRPGLNKAPEEIIINSIGGMFGYKYEWDL